MTAPKQRVFLSYTGEDLHGHARAVAAELRKWGHEPVDHVEWASNGRPSVRECRDRIAECDVLVVIVAHRYGWVPKTSEDGDGERSITWLEVEEARRLDIPVLPFVIDDKSEWPATHMEGLRNPLALQRLDRFKLQLRAGIAGFFSVRSGLETEVVRAVEADAERREREPRRPTPSRAGDAIATYRKRLERQLRRVKFLGFGEQFQVSLAISELWVPLSASVPRSFQVEDDKLALKGEHAHAEQQRATRVEDAFREAQRYDLRGVILLGDPGSGKTTAARRIAWQCADLVQGSASLGLPEDVVPVLLRLRELPKDEFGVGLEPMLLRQLGSIDLSDDDELGKRLLKRGRILWILDGLDEVASLEARAKVSAWVRHACEKRVDDWFLVTSRYAGYEKQAALGEDFLRVEVSPLDAGQRRDFVSRWYLTVERHIRGDEPEAHSIASTRSSELLSLLESQEVLASVRLASMAANPLLLSILCIVHRRDMNLPRRRADLYCKCVDVLLDSWRDELRKLHGSNALDTAVARLVLQPIAWWLHQTESRTEAPVGEIVTEATRTVERIQGASDAAGILKTIHDESGLLVTSQPGHYAFLHLTFQEYLAARHCVDKGLAKELATGFGVRWWNEPILLALSIASNEAFVSEFFEAVLATRDFEADAARALLDLSVRESLIVPKAPFLSRLKSSKTPAPLLRVLVQLFKESKDADLAAAAQAVDERLRNDEVREARAAIRSREEDLRWVDSVTDVAGPGLVTHRDHDTGIVLVRVPAGEFEMGGERHDDEQPLRRVRVASFWLAPHPVTNAQYERFLRDTKRGAPKYWTNSKFNAPSQPVVGVSWEDAQAYCKWARLVLPSEAQWEYACRAGTKTEYWSGDKESDLERVGWYVKNSGGKPHAVAEKSANPFGLYDMHGNVWEWCEDTMQPNYKGAPIDGSAWVVKASVGRVIRGGSFGFTAGYARSAYRYRTLPSYRWSVLGFRPARSVTTD